MVYAVNASFKVAGAFFCEDTPAVGVGIALRAGSQYKSHSETSSTGEFYIYWKGGQQKDQEWFLQFSTDCKKVQKTFIIRIPSENMFEENPPPVVYDVGIVDISRIETIGTDIVVEEPKKKTKRVTIKTTQKATSQQIIIE
ncbi:hypothetical protein GCK32_017889 [Trichostrongylus colubriformis]|uniref:Uncharacterized protein n=1 Tax=Trichostrongylus colubriformis TaxID=6319 RepID=A0AAN8IEC4_TRICO